MPDDVFDDQNDDSGTGSPPLVGGAPPDTGSPEGSDSKRINDLMSNWQKAEARAQKAEALLASQAAAAPGSRGDRGQPAKPVDEWLEYNRRLVRESLYTREPRFERYGIGPDSIEGATPAEMQASFDRQKALVEKIETKARNDALAEHGLVPELAGGLGGSEPADFASMSTDEFEKFVARQAARTY